MAGLLAEEDRIKTWVSEDLTDAYAQLGLSAPVPGQHVQRPLNLDRSNCASIALWPSNAAIVSTATNRRTSESTFHAWDHHADQVIDENVLSSLPGWRSLGWSRPPRRGSTKQPAHGTPILNVACLGGGAALLSPYPPSRQPNDLPSKPRLSMTALRSGGGESVRGLGLCPSIIGLRNSAGGVILVEYVPGLRA